MAKAQAVKRQVNIIKDLVLGGVVSPAALSGTVNDYDPGWGAASVARIDPGGAARSITGLLAPLVAGTVKAIVNLGAATQNITLEHADAGSVAANRIQGANLADVVVRPGGCALLWYDGTSTCWRVLSVI